jgi:hypothetical protein
MSFVDRTITNFENRDDENINSEISSPSFSKIIDKSNIDAHFNNNYSPILPSQMLNC